ncbi:MAG: hypothetical protein HY928_03185 [Elusimicrobia bacterium]|nr:hypothetical protein [Elusimicrobiota bacterium]
MRRGLRPNARSRAGFGGPHVELMPVVAIIGILAAIAIPKFADLIRKSNEGASKGNLGAIRSALSISYGDNEGVYPYHPAALLAEGKYLRGIPKAKTPNYHADSTAVRLGAGSWDGDDSGGWLYVGDPASEDFGAVFVNCTHTDTKGSSWTVY